MRFRQRRLIRFPSPLRLKKTTSMQAVTAIQFMKSFSQITPEDLLRKPVWEFANDLESTTNEEAVLRPCHQLPIRDFGNRIVGAIGTLANGARLTLILQNVDLESPYKTEHLITLTIFNSIGEKFFLARYHDIAIETHGPDQLSRFLQLSEDDIFPIAYDISDVAIGHPDSLRGTIPIVPRRKLTRAEIMDLVIG